LTCRGVKLIFSLTTVETPSWKNSLVKGDKEVKVGCVGREVSLGKCMSTKLYMVAITIMEGHK